MDRAQRLRPQLRVAALVPIVLFIPSLVSFAATKPGAVWPEYTGVFFHLAILLVIATLPAQEWARAAGYGWIALDVLSGILTINGLPYDTAWPVRLSGHVLAGTWLIVASLENERWSIRLVGILSGLDLGLYSFVANSIPLQALYPSSILLVIWLLLLAVYGDETPHGQYTQKSSTTRLDMYRPTRTPHVP